MKELFHCHTQHTVHVYVECLVVISSYYGFNSRLFQCQLSLSCPQNIEQFNQVLKIYARAAKSKNCYKKLYMIQNYMRLRLLAIDTKPYTLCYMYVTLTCSSVVQTAYTCEQRMLVSAVASSSQYFMGARLDVLHEEVKIVVRQPTREDSRITLWGTIWYVKQ